MMNWEEFTAKSVSDALTEASVSLKVPSSMLEYEVIEESKSGLLGLFSKPAKIRVRVRTEEELKKEAEKEVEKYSVKETKREEKAIIKKEIKKDNRKEINKNSTVEENNKNATSVDKNLETNVDVENIARKFLTDVFEAMKIEATLKIDFNSTEDIININVEGEDMGILIGKRGQTLDSLQYLTSLVINKETESYLKVKLDTENYRERRKETLENLAKNIAFKVKRTKHSVSLEPMNPYERRIIHSALQSDKYVDTHSEGEEPYRKVVITLKKGYHDYNSNGKSNYNRNNNKKDYKKNFSEKETAEVKTEE